MKVYVVITPDPEDNCWMAFATYEKAYDAACAKWGSTQDGICVNGVEVRTFFDGSSLQEEPF